MAVSVPLGVVWRILPSPGLTPGGKLHQFQQRTADKLVIIGRTVGAQTLENMRQRMNARFTSQHPGHGKLANSLGLEVTATRQGVTVVLGAGNYRELNFITALGGGDFKNQPYEISPNKGEYLVFFWHSPNGPNHWVRLPKARHPGFGPNDILLEEANKGGSNFIKLTQAAVYDGLVAAAADDKVTVRSTKH